MNNFSWLFNCESSLPDVIAFSNFIPVPIRDCGSNLYVGMGVVEMF